MECPKECLSHGVPAAVLQFFDFFSMHKQKLVLKIVANVLGDFSAKDAAKAMEAAPVLCNLLQSTDKTILDSAVSCLVLVSDGACDSAQHMEKLYELNAVQATMRLMENDGWKSLSDETLSGILGLLKDLASLSARAVKSLFELNICDLLKQMITYYTSSHSDHNKDLDIYDIPSFDPKLGKTVMEFQALVKRKKFLEERASNPAADLSYKNVRLEDLCLDFTLPGNPEYELVPGGSEKMVTLDNLEEYVSSIVDATLKSGISNQIEAFKAGINKVCEENIQ
ncbi:Os05g0122400 [Oryza sativa Japonica Group]|uniref:HECT-type E3 ubiquitin transferase n=1 Tax=Oryza sativa subsp. japonica TaxID=39947 RepID=Q0DL56_ORYSJ|nr:Os05g0122400 [Oryza sativa Japonica Group]|eukprot:NP_001054503.2 Os05g0122400 [Oryza sativa Japonica Group]